MTSRTGRKKWFGTVIVMATLLTFGCAGSQQTTKADRMPGEAAGATEAEQSMRAQSRNFDETVWQGALTGAAAGAAAGALWGILSGDSLTNTALKAGMGAAAGAAAGALAGKYVAHKQETYANRLDQLDSMIKDVKQSNEDTKAFIASVREVVAEDERKLAAMNTKSEQGLITEDELSRERQNVAENREVVVKAIDGAKKKLAMFEGAKNSYQEQNPDVDTQEFAEELEIFNEHIETLDGIAEGFKTA